MITGSRAEYGLLKPVMTAIQKCPLLELKIIVTGMHLDSDFGYTVVNIVDDGFKITEKIENDMSYP